MSVPHLTPVHLSPHPRHQGRAAGFAVIGLAQGLTGLPQGPSA